MYVQCCRGCGSGLCWLQVWGYYHYFSRFYISWYWAVPKLYFRVHLPQELGETEFGLIRLKKTRVKTANKWYILPKLSGPLNLKVLAASKSSFQLGISLSAEGKTYHLKPFESWVAQKRWALQICGESGCIAQKKTKLLPNTQEHRKCSSEAISLIFGKQQQGSFILGCQKLHFWQLWLISVVFEPLI